MLIGVTGCAATPHDSLPSWNDGPAKSAITDFVGGVTTEGSPDVVRAAPEMEMVIRKSPLALTQHVPTQVENPSTGGCGPPWLGHGKATTLTALAQQAA
jgi:hypothetical protein